MRANLLNELQYFTGTETWHRHGLNRDVLYTDGAAYVAERAGAFWLLDEIALAQLEPSVKVEDFQVWKLAVLAHRAVLSCEDGNGRIVLTKGLEFTDFPEPGITLWFTGGVILLPSEY